MTKLSEKYDRVLKYCEKEVDKITKMFKRQREDPPLPRNYSPVAGILGQTALAKARNSSNLQNITNANLTADYN